MGFCFTGGERAICVTLSRGIILIRCFCTCFRCVERFGSSRRRKMLGTNNVSNHSLSFFRPRFCLSFLCSSPHPPGSPFSPCSPPHSCCPLGPRPDTLLAWTPTNGLMRGARGGMEDWGSRAVCFSRIGGWTAARGHQAKGMILLGGTSYFFLFLILNSTSQPQQSSHSGHLMKQLCKLGWLQLWVFKYLETLLSFKKKKEKKKNEFVISLLWRQAGKTR